MSELVRINKDTGLYVMECGSSGVSSGVSCYGFDVLDNKAVRACQWVLDTFPYLSDGQQSDHRLHKTLAESKLYKLGVTAPGNEYHYYLCQGALDDVRRFCEAMHLQCPIELVPSLIGKEGRRVEGLHYHERIRFTVGKSTGWMPVHLIIKTRRSRGGEAISVDKFEFMREV